jgi:sulfane dehydrogenase subunit SoxC
MEWGGAQLEGCQFTQGMIHNMEYTGVPLRLLLEEAGVKPEGKWVYAEGADASSNGRSMPLEKALDDVLVAFFANGEALRKEHGYPVRLVVPGFEGNMWVKWLRRIGVYDQAVESREETSKYTDLMADGSARKWTWVMDAKSVITSPSPQAPIRHGKGPLVITGLAWSGHGKIDRVDVSLDGGRNWQTARLSGDVKPKALTRFHLDVDWDGSEMLLQSRAIDETGYVQPTKDQLRDIRGLNNVYHNNSIQTWWVRADGEVENVEVA